MSKSAWRRRRVGLVLGVVSALVIGIAAAPILFMTPYGLMSHKAIGILGAVIVVSIICAVLGTMVLSRANRELMASGELNLAAARRRSAEARRKSSVRGLYTTSAYAVVFVVVAVVIRSRGDSHVLPWGAIASISGLFAWTFLIELFGLKRADRDSRDGT